MKICNNRGQTFEPTWRPAHFFGRAKWTIEFLCKRETSGLRNFGQQKWTPKNPVLLNRPNRYISTGFLPPLPFFFPHAGTNDFIRVFHEFKCTFSKFPLRGLFKYSNTTVGKSIYNYIWTFWTQNFRNFWNLYINYMNVPHCMLLIAVSNRVFFEKNSQKPLSETHRKSLC